VCDCCAACHVFEPADRSIRAGVTHASVFDARAVVLHARVFARTVKF